MLESNYRCNWTIPLPRLYKPERREAETETEEEEKEEGEEEEKKNEKEKKKEEKEKEEERKRKRKRKRERKRKRKRKRKRNAIWLYHVLLCDYISMKSGHIYLPGVTYIYNYIYLDAIEFLFRFHGSRICE